MANPVLSTKRFDKIHQEDQDGWAAAASTQGNGVTNARDARLMTANGTFARTFVLVLLLVVSGVFGWSQVTVLANNTITTPAWLIVALLAAFGVAMVCAFMPKSAPIAAPIYAILEGAVLGAISHMFEARWDGIVLQAVLVTAGVFITTLVLYVTGVVKVTKKFTMVVIGAVFGILFMYIAGFLMSLFGVDIMFWNEPTPLGIIISFVIAVVAALMLFLDFEFIRQASLAGSPAYMEWYGAFGLTVTLVWLYLEVLRLISLIRN